MPSNNNFSQFTRFRAFTHKNPLINDANARNKMENLIYEHMFQVIERIMVYPPLALAEDGGKSRYERTFTLRDNWLWNPVKAMGDGLQGSLFNEACDPEGEFYADKVQGPNQISERAATGWKKITDKDILDRSGYNKKVRALIREMAKGGV